MLHEQQAAPPPPASPPPPPPAAAPLPPATPTHDDDDGETEEPPTATFRDIHPLTPTSPSSTRAGSVASWDAASSRSFSSSSEEQYMTMSREFTAMVAAGATTQNPGAGGDGASDPLASIGEDEADEETNPLAIVPDSHPVATPARSSGRAPPALDLEVVPAGPPPRPVEASQVKKEEVETKVAAWQTAKMAKINNRFKREEVVINGWETEQVEKAAAWLKKIERKLDEQRAKAVERTQNDIAMARRKAEEKRASAEAKRGLKLAKVLELANFMKAVGRVPTKRSFF